MSDEFIRKVLLEKQDVVSAEWRENRVMEIERKERDRFLAAILSERVVLQEHVRPFVNSPVSVIVNFPRIGRWTGEAIAQCEAAGKAWGQWSVLLRALTSDSPETTVNPEINFSRTALAQHTRVESVRFASDRILIVEHELGNKFRVALMNQYDLCGNDVRQAWGENKPFDVVLRTNPNGSTLPDSYEVAESLGIRIFRLREFMGYLAKGAF